MQSPAQQRRAPFSAEAQTAGEITTLAFLHLVFLLSAVPWNHVVHGKEEGQG